MSDTHQRECNDCGEIFQAPTNIGAKPGEEAKAVHEWGKCPLCGGNSVPSNWKRPAIGEIGVEIVDAAEKTREEWNEILNRRK